MPNFYDNGYNDDEDAAKEKNTQRTEWKSRLQRTEALNPVWGLRESNQLTKGPSSSDEEYCGEMLTKKKVNFSRIWLPGQFPSWKNFQTNKMSSLLLLQPFLL